MKQETQIKTKLNKIKLTNNSRSKREKNVKHYNSTPILVEVNRTSLVSVIRQDRTVRSNTNRTIRMHCMTLAVPTRDLEPNNRRDLNPENHFTARQVRSDLIQLLASRREGGAAKRSGDHCRVLRLLVEWKQHRRTTQSLILLVEHPHLHGIIVNADVLIRVSGRDVVGYHGIANREALDEETGPVGAEAEPQDEGDDAYQEKKP